MHTYVHTCIHTYIPTYIPRYVHTYIHTTHSCARMCVHRKIANAEVLASSQDRQAKPHMLDAIVDAQTEDLVPLGVDSQHFGHLRASLASTSRCCLKQSPSGSPRSGLTRVLALHDLDGVARHDLSDVTMTNSDYAPIQSVVAACLPSSRAEFSGQEGAASVVCLGSRLPCARELWIPQITALAAVPVVADYGIRNFRRSQAAAQWLRATKKKYHHDTCSSTNVFQGSGHNRQDYPNDKASGINKTHSAHETTKVWGSPTKVR